MTNTEEILTPEQRAKKEAKEAQRLEKLAKFEAKQKKLQEQKQKDAASPKVKPEKPKKEVVSTIDYDPNTPFGEKKIFVGEMANAYDPEHVEKTWYSWWEKNKLFKPEINKDAKESYVIPIPPPNVTGSLHLGHALTIAVQDSIIRWKRMNGYAALYIPGSDHAGIATQAVVEKKLQRERNITRHDIGREEFVKEVWKWKEKFGSTIYEQFRSLGASLDWTRVKFTLDDSMNTAVNKAFVTLHEEGLIYRDNRLVNWCGKLNTALSDQEVDHRELTEITFMQVHGHEKKHKFGTIMYFKYKLYDSEDFITVATTRPETILGDTAVAVNPSDKRYEKYHGKFLKHPFSDRKIPIVLDEAADPEFGSGAVKVTPAHDPNDFEIGKRHKLPFINILNDDNTINENGGSFAGLPRFVAREKVIEELKAQGLYIEEKFNPGMNIPICSRSGDVIEPRIKPQWWVNCKGMAKLAMDAVRNGDIEIIPKEQERTYFTWLENIRDWCISRQLWWGHRIPAYQANDGKYWVSGNTEKEAYEKAKQLFPNANITLKQDEDVLDTWFSSGLWPFSTLGWPENFYPASLLETGKDILFFWVIRMIMMGLKLTGKSPFKKVYLHPMVRDAHGRKMSKSKGNVIDPRDVIEGIPLEELHKKLENSNLDASEVQKAKEGQKLDFPNGIPKCGSDALRFALCAYLGSSRDINLDVLRIEGYRKFCNKLWNACKFVMMKLGSSFVPDERFKLSGHENAVDKWILAKLNQATVQFNKGMEEFNFMDATTAVHSFWLYSFCDYYIEAVKADLNGDETPRSRAIKNILYTCLEQGLKLLHPMMPFITEELYQRLNRRPNDQTISISVSSFPVHNPLFEDTISEARIDHVFEVTRAIRSLMVNYNLNKNATVFIQVSQKINEYSVIKNLIKGLETVAILNKQEAIPEGCVVNNLNEECNVYLLVKGYVNVGEETSKINAKLLKTRTALSQLDAKMSAESYEVNVKEEVKDLNSKKVRELAAEIEVLEKVLENLLRITE